MVGLAESRMKNIENVNFEIVFHFLNQQRLLLSLKWTQKIRNSNESFYLVALSLFWFMFLLIKAVQSSCLVGLQ